MKYRKSFTLIEVLIAVALIAALSATALIFYGRRPSEKANESVVVNNVEGIRRAEISRKLTDDAYIPANNTAEVNERLETNIPVSPAVNYKVVNVTESNFEVVAEGYSGGSSSPVIIASASSSSSSSSYSSGGIYSSGGSVSGGSTSGSRTTTGEGTGTTVSSCPSNSVLCNGQCADIQADNSNCGGCGQACSAGQSCLSGTCTVINQSCPSGQALCNGVCVNLQADSSNCGSCGQVCPTGKSCSAGSCVVITLNCPTGQTDCSGTCVNLQADSSNCGSCGQTCPAGQACASGSCAVVQQCPTGQTDCSGTCVNLQTDFSNCGSCAHSCSVGQACTLGSCTIVLPNCPSGQTACGSMCYNLQTDSDNCGACGNVCPRGVPCTGGGCGGGGLDAILEILHDSSAGSSLYNLIDAHDITIEYLDLSGNPTMTGVVAYWQYSTNKIVINQAVAGTWTNEAVAAVVGHELIHADYDYNSTTWINSTLAAHPELTAADLHITVYPGNSIDQEYNAFVKAAQLWTELKGTQTNTTLDNIVYLNNQGEAYLKASIRATAAYQTLPEY
jgi:type II secretory pathway pseudopilin PulG